MLFMMQHRKEEGRPQRNVIKLGGSTMIQPLSDRFTVQQHGLGWTMPSPRKRAPWASFYSNGPKLGRLTLVRHSLNLSIDMQQTWLCQY